MGTKNKERKERRKTVSCGTLVYRHPSDAWGDTEILLVKQFAHKDNWGIPKGHMAPGETIEQCALRETKEEAGIDVVLGGRLPDAFAVYKKEEKTVISFLAQQACNRVPCSGDPDSEVADARWFKVGNLPQIHSYQRGLVAAGIDIIYVRFNLAKAIHSTKSA